MEYPFLWYYAYAGDGQPPTVINLTMFHQSMLAFCNEEQNKKWMPLIEGFDISGCYAQTEIGHGSDVMGL